MGVCVCVCINLHGHVAVVPALFLILFLDFFNSCPLKLNLINFSLGLIKYSDFNMQYKRSPV